MQEYPKVDLMLAVEGMGGGLIELRSIGQPREAGGCFDTIPER